jgi:hypothetical protein
VSWSENTESRCNNMSCQKKIFWNELIRHPQTKRMRPLDEPYYPDLAKEVLHLCMKKTPPKTFINKYQKYYKDGYTTSEILAMRDPTILAAWNKQRKDWLEKWK